MSQMQMPSGIMWGQRPGQQPPYNPAPTGQNPQMLGMGPPGSQPPGMPGQPPGMAQYQSLMQNAMQPPQGGPPPGSYAPAPNPQWQGSQGTPQSPWTGNNFASQPMGGQTQSMGPGSPSPGAGAPPMDMSQFSQSTGGSPYGANGQMSRTPTTTNLSGPMAMGNLFPKPPAPKPGIVNQTSGGAGALNVNGQNRPPSGFMGAGQYPSLAQNALNQQPPDTMTPGGNNSSGPISASPSSPSPQSDPNSYPQNGAAQFGGASGYSGGGNSGGIGAPVGGPSSDPATLQAQMAANAAAFRRASMTQGNNNQRNNFNPAAAGIGQPMQTGLAGIPTPGALYSGGAATLAPSSNWQRQPYNPWAGGPRPALRMQ